MTEPEHQQFFPRVAVFFSGAAVDGVNECQMGELREVFGVGRGWVVENQEYISGRIFAGVLQIVQHGAEDFHGEGIEEEAAVYLFGNGEVDCILLEQRHSIAPRGGLLIGTGSFVEAWIVLNADGVAFCLAREEKADPAFAAAVVHHGIALVNIAAAGELFEYGVIGRLIGIANQVGNGVIPSRGFDMQQFVPVVFQVSHKV